MKLENFTNKNINEMNEMIQLKENKQLKYIL